MNFLILTTFLSFHLIPSQFHERDSLYKYFNTTDSIISWEFGHCDLFSNSKVTVYNSDTSSRILIPPLNSLNTFRSVYFNVSGVADYLFYKNRYGQIRFVQNPEELQDFVGTIDNLAEALFIASIYGYYLIPGMEFGSYKLEDGSYILNLHKIIDSAGNLPIIYLDKGGNQKHQKIIKVRIRVDKDGSLYLMKGRINRTLIKLQKKDIHRLTY